jgi:Excinuclease ABC subunit B
MSFQVEAPYQPTGDQPEAIAQLVAGINRQYKHQTLLGATGTGKTAVMAWIFAQVQRPTLVLAHNKTLVSQLWAEFRELLPDAAVEMFISYYDEYTPEAYVPGKDLYIEKQASINEEIDVASRRNPGAVYPA